MSVALLLLALDVALLAGAAIFLLLVIFRRGPTMRNFGLGALLLVLAALLWYTTIRTPPPFS